MKSVRKSIDLKIILIFSAAMLFLTTILIGISSFSMYKSAKDAAFSMAENKMNGDLNAATMYLADTCGALSLKDGHLQSSDNTEIDGKEEIVDRISNELGVEATVFIRDGNDFRRVITSIKNEKNERVIGTMLGAQSAAYQPMLEGKTYLGKAAILGHEYVTGYKPIIDSGKNVIGILFVGIKMTKLNNSIGADLHRGILFLILAALAILALSLCVGIVIVRKTISIPVRNTVSMLKDLSEGEGDLTKRLEVKSHDEIGEMSRYFNLTLDKVKSLVIAIKKQSSVLDEIGLELASNMNETAASIQQINANIQSIKNQTLNQSASVTETNSTMTQIIQNIQKLNEHIDQQATNVNQSSSAIEEMLANIASVTNALAKNEQNVTELAGAAEIGHSDLAAVSESIFKIAKESEGLLEVSRVIESVASQTNLLSMNAAIEAAHAGDSGRGFAVVADEIRKLAESSGNQSKTVSSSLKKIKEAMGSISGATATVLKQFESIDDKIKTVTEREHGIRNAMDEQNSGSKEILDAVGQLTDITAHVKSGSNEMFTGSQEIIRESANLGRITAEVTGSMNEMAAGVEQITTALSKINEISQENKESIAALTAEVRKFKV